MATANLEFAALAEHVEKRDEMMVKLLVTIGNSLFHSAAPDELGCYAKPTAEFVVKLLNLKE